MQGEETRLQNILHGKKTSFEFHDVALLVQLYITMAKKR
jgi:hypothetical protein